MKGQLKSPSRAICGDLVDDVGWRRGIGATAGAGVLRYLHNTFNAEVAERAENAGEMPGTDQENLISLQFSTGIASGTPNYATRLSVPPGRAVRRSVLQRPSRLVRPT